MNRHDRRKLGAMLGKALPVNGHKLEPGCSFCGRRLSELDGLAPAPSGASICDVCAELACLTMGKHEEHLLADAIEFAEHAAWRLAFSHAIETAEGWQVLDWGAGHAGEQVLGACFVINALKHAEGPT